MKFILATLPVFVLSVLAAPFTSRATVEVSYDPKYDAPAGSLTDVSCSNGATGLIPQGYNNFQDLPNFPYIGGSPTIAGWGSPQCGQCYRLDYQSAQGPKAIYVTAIDSAPRGFNIALKAFNDLTANMGVDLGRVNANYEQVDRTLCKFPAAAV